MKNLKQSTSKLTVSNKKNRKHKPKKQIVLVKFL